MSPRAIGCILIGVSPEGVVVADVFLSYSHQDRARAEEVAKALREAGRTVFWDRGLEAGERWSHELAKELEDSGAAVVLWSEASVDARWVEEEAIRASALHLLIPARIDKVDPPLGFASIQTYDLTDPELERNPDLARLLETVGRPAQAARRASERVRHAFRLRSQGNFEEATKELENAFEEFEALLDEDQKKSHEQAKGYKDETIKVLEGIVREFGGDLKPTLSGASILPIVDAVLDLPRERVRQLLVPCCTLDEKLAARETVRVGVVIRPGPAINSYLLVSQLLDESGGRNGPLDIHCYLVIIMDRDGNTATAERFAREATSRDLLASCLNWVPGYGSKGLKDRLDDTVHRLCAQAATHTATTP